MNLFFYMNDESVIPKYGTIEHGANLNLHIFI